MNELLKIFLSLSFSGSILILVLFLFKPLFKKKISKVWQYYIWLVVIARLLLPFAPETNFPKQEDLIGKQSSTESNRQTNPDTYSVANILATLVQNLWLIWLIAVLVLLIRKITEICQKAHYFSGGMNGKVLLIST